MNILLALPLAAAGALLFLFAQRLLQNKSLALLVVVLWSASLPMLSTAAWQPTVLDRIGVMLALAMLWASASCSQDVTSERMLRIAGRSVCYLAGTFACLNSMEEYWLIPLAAAGAHCFTGPAADRCTPFIDAITKRSGVCCHPLR